MVLQRFTFAKVVVLMLSVMVISGGCKEQLPVKAVFVGQKGNNLERTLDVSLPARAAFYYPWFPETWTVGGEEVTYKPVLGNYSSDARVVLDAHISALTYAKVNVGVVSWWGSGTHHEDKRIPLLLERTRAANADLKWGVYYEKEGFGDPSLSEIRSDLAYLEANYTASPGYARVNGRPVIFVYNADDTGCSVAERWAQATRGEWYVVLKVFAGYRDCANQPDSWHQYAPAVPADQQSGYSYAVSPGFWRADEGSPRLARDLLRFKQNVRDMVASGEPWHLITTFNEWGEGTAVEEADEWGKAYLDILATDGGDTVTSAAPDSADSYSATNASRRSTSELLLTAQSGDRVIFAAAGDFGGQESMGGALLDDIAVRGDIDAFFLLGGVTYGQKAAQSWCDWVHDKLGATFPVQLVGGKREDDSSKDGFILDFIDCMPDQLKSSLGPGGYGVSYASDMGPVTVIMTSPDLRINGVTYSYGEGAQQSWLVEAIRSAKREGDWVVVGMHKNCVTIGEKSCDIGGAFSRLLVAEKVDLVLQAHEHSYQRSHALVQVQAGSVPPGAVADDGGDNSYCRGAGTVLVISGMVGRPLARCNHADPEEPYFAAHHCSEEGVVRGYLLLEVSATELAAQYVALPDWDTFNDAFSIR